MRNLILALVALFMTILTLVVMLTALFTGWIALMWWVNPQQSYRFYEVDVEHYALSFVGLALLSSVLVVSTFLVWKTFIDSLEEGKE